MEWTLLEKTAVELSRTLIQFGLNWLLQSSILICCGLSIGVVIRRYGSAFKSAIYRMTLTSILVCPLVSWCFSQAGILGWSIELPSNTRQIQGGDSDHAITETLLADNHTSRSESVARNSDTIQPRGKDPGTSFSMTRSESGASDRSTQQASTLTNTALITSRNTSVSKEKSDRGRMLFDTALTVLSTLWFSVTAWLLLRLSLAWWRLAAIRRQAVAVDLETMAACRAYATKLGVRAPNVFETPFLPSPCLAGIWNPVILLPEETMKQSRDEVLIHELAHLSRNDCRWNLLSKLTTTIFWFQPLLWVFTRRLEVAAEEVCDDFVVNFSGDREGYARRLVDMAELARFSINPAGVAMVSLQSILAHRVVRILDHSRQVTTSVSRTSVIGTSIVSLLGMLIVGFVGAAPLRQELPESALNPPQREKPAQRTLEDVTNSDSIDVVMNDDKGPNLQEQSRMAKEAIGDICTIRGQVLKPDGQPAAGAKVTVRCYPGISKRNPPIGVTTSATDGRFKVTYPKSLDSEHYFWVAAQLEGYGFQMADRQEVNESTDLVLKLVTDSPIHGRIIDLEGHSIEGVRVKIADFYVPGTDDGLEPWLKSVKSGAVDQVSAFALGKSMPVCDDDNEQPIVTDRDGRFTLLGVGAERRVTLELQGKTIAYQKIDLVTRAMTSIIRNVDSNPESNQQPFKGIVLGKDFAYAAQPTQIVEGFVRDAKSKKGVPGVTIESEHLAGTLLYGIHVLRTQTDSEGHYQLVGLPRGDDNVIQIFSDGETAYQLRHIKVPKPSGDAITKLDIEMEPGLWITGKVTDKLTGKPANAIIFYLPFVDNPFTKNRPEFHDEYMDHSQFHYMTDSDGNYRIPGLPGRAIVAVKSLYGSYRKGVGAENIDGMTEKGEFATYRQVTAADSTFHDVLKEINPAENSQSITCDLELDPGATIRVMLVDPEGNPLEGTDIVGRNLGSHELSQPSSIDVSGMSPNETRIVQVIHRERRLGKIFEVHFDGQTTDPVTITLQPTATIKGRLVDQDGRAVKNTGLLAWPNFNARNRTGVFEGTSCNSEGTFEFSSLSTGCESYSLKKLDLIKSDIKTNIIVQPGELIDLGDVILEK